MIWIRRICFTSSDAICNSIDAIGNGADSSNDTAGHPTSHCICDCPNTVDGSWEQRSDLKRQDGLKYLFPCEKSWVGRLWRCQICRWCCPTSRCTAGSCRTGCRRPVSGLSACLRMGSDQFWSKTQPSLLSVAVLTFTLSCSMWDSSDLQ